MTLNGTDISTLGLKLLKLDDFYNLPARKRILSTPAFGTNDIRIDSRRAVVKLFGTYASQQAMADAVAGLKTLLQASVPTAVAISSRSITFNGVADEGFKTRTKRTALWIDLPFTIVT